MQSPQLQTSEGKTKTFVDLSQNGKMDVMVCRYSYGQVVVEWACCDGRGVHCIALLNRVEMVREWLVFLAEHSSCATTTHCVFCKTCWLCVLVALPHCVGFIWWASAFNLAHTVTANKNKNHHHDERWFVVKRVLMMSMMISDSSLCFLMLFLPFVENNYGLGCVRKRNGSQNDEKKKMRHGCKLLW